MNWKEAIASVDMSKDDGWFDLEPLCSYFEINYYSLKNENEIEKVIKKRWIHSWICTDTRVGLAVYYFNDRPFAVSFQAARKCEKTIEFISKEIFEEVRQYLWERTSSSEDLPILDPEGEIHDSWFEKEDR